MFIQGSQSGVSGADRLLFALRRFIDSRSFLFGREDPAVGRRRARSWAGASSIRPACSSWSVFIERTFGVDVLDQRDAFLTNLRLAGQASTQLRRSRSAMQRPVSRLTAMPGRSSFCEQSAARVPHKTALVVGDRRWTYRRTGRLGEPRWPAPARLTALARWDRVASFSSSNGVEAVMSVFAALKAGGVFIVVSPQRQAGQAGCSC